MTNVFNLILKAKFAKHYKTNRILKGSFFSADNSILITDDGTNDKTAISSVPNNGSAAILLTKSTGSSRKKRQTAAATTTPHPGAIKTDKLGPGCRYGEQFFGAH